jgi:hypothetical protein
MSYYLSSYYSPYARSAHWDSPYAYSRYASPYYYGASSYAPYYSRYSSYASPYWRSSYYGYAAPVPATTEVRTTTVDESPYSPARTTTTTVERRSPVSHYDTSYAYATRDYDHAYPSYRSQWYDRPYYGSRYYDYSPYSTYRSYYI